MDFYGKYKSPLGYQTGENQIDSYGVDHSGFTLRDELAYQMARQQRENQIIKNFHNQGITQDYPQAGNNFWGNSPDNNFGFGTSNIANNIENRPPQTQQTSLSQQFANNFINNIRKYGIDEITTSLHNLGYDGGERAYDYINNSSQNLKEYDNLSSVGKAQAEASRLTPVSVSDVNKHQYVSCVGAFDGPLAAALTAVAGMYKEGSDLYRKWNNPRYGTNGEIIADSIKDLKNDFLGIAKGLSSSDINQCSSILPQKARKQML